jgi:hypothetical protein
MLTNIINCFNSLKENFKEKPGGGKFENFSNKAYSGVLRKIFKLSSP